LFGGVPLCYVSVAKDILIIVKAVGTRSYLGKIPSKDFYGEAYELFLEYASPEELETDTLKRETLQKISIKLGFI
jgi:hypothetical protein